MSKQWCSYEHRFHTYLPHTLPFMDVALTALYKFHVQLQLRFFSPIKCVVVNLTDIGLLRMA